MRYYKMYPAALCFCAFLAATGLILGDPAQVIPGIRTIILTEDALITDYIQIAGMSAAFVNSALVTLISLILLRLCGEPVNGFTLVELGLMAGFALFGKNIANIWPIIAGTFLYAGIAYQHGSGVLLDFKRQYVVSLCKGYADGGLPYLWLLVGSNAYLQGGRVVAAGRVEADPVGSAACFPVAVRRYGYLQSVLVLVDAEAQFAGGVYPQVGSFFLLAGGEQAQGAEQTHEPGGGCM